MPHLIPSHSVSISAKPPNIKEDTVKNNFDRSFASPSVVFPFFAFSKLLNDWTDFLESYVTFLIMT